VSLILLGINSPSSAPTTLRSPGGAAVVVSSGPRAGELARLDCQDLLCSRIKSDRGRYETSRRDPLSFLLSATFDFTSSLSSLSERRVDPVRRRVHAFARHTGSSPRFSYARRQVVQSRMPTARIRITRSSRSWQTSRGSRGGLLRCSVVRRAGRSPTSSAACFTFELARQLFGSAFVNQLYDAPPPDRADVIAHLEPRWKCASS
jgi:hypothetical protein